MDLCRLLIVAIATMSIHQRCYAYINNFRFKHTNTINGDTLPFRVRLTGTYYLDIVGTPELTEFPEGYLTATKLAANSPGPWVCTQNAAELIASVNATKERDVTDKLKDAISKVNSLTSDINQIIRTWSPFVDVNTDRHSCKILDVTTDPDIQAGSTFTFEHTFTNYEPIIFVDQLGIGTFNYKRSFAPAHPHHSSGNPPRYCGGLDFVGDMYTFSKRPTCPLNTQAESRTHGRAMITVYKANIVNIRHETTRCMQHMTRVHSYENIFGTSRDQWRRTKSVKTGERACKEWKESKSACNSFTRQALDEVDNTRGGAQGYHHNREWCTFATKPSQNNAISEYKTSPYLDYEYSKGEIVGWDMRHATLTEGFMEVSMPSMTMATPWTTIPKENTYKGSYDINNMTLIWEPFKPSDLCLYVPRFRGEVDYVKYQNGNFDVQVDIKRGEDDKKYTLFLLSDSYNVMFNVDSAQKIKDTTSLNCMPHKSDYRTTLYQTSSDQIIMVTFVDDLSKPASKRGVGESHIPAKMRHVGMDDQAHSAYSSIHVNSGTGRVQTVVGSDSHTTRPSKKGDPTKVYDMVVPKPKDSDFPTPSHIMLTSEDSIGYVMFKQKETERNNLHVRAMQNCFINQMDWDVYTQLLDINPSRAISKRLNMAVEATHGGNGFYNVKRCELANDVIIVGTLRTSSAEAVLVNGVHKTVKQIVHEMGVSPDPEKCFAMPLVVFSSSLTGGQIVGQLTLDGIVRDKRLAYIEPCGRNKAHIFTVGDYSHFFFDYKRNFTERVEVIQNITEQLHHTTKFMKQHPLVSSDASPASILRDHALNKIHTINIVQPDGLKEREYQHYPTGLYSNSMYSVTELQSVSLGLTKLMEEDNYERYALREFTIAWANDRESIDSGLGAEGFSDALGEFFIDAEHATGELVEDFGKGIEYVEDGAGDLARGIGDGASTAAKGIFGAVGDALSSTFMSLGLPLLGVAVLAIVGVIVYKQLTGGGDNDNVEHTPSPYDDSADNDMMMMSSETKTNGHLGGGGSGHPATSRLRSDLQGSRFRFVT